MELLKAIVLGVVQGATEFLPVSSSGHLVLGAHILGFNEQGIVFDVMLHLGTLVSVVIVFWKELWAMASAPLRWCFGNRGEENTQFLLWDVYVVIATMPAAVIGVAFKETFEMMFSSILVVCLMLVLTGVLMILTRYLPERSGRVTWLRALLIGCAQACAIIPGISRSGSTIFTGMLLGVDRETVARFSFIMSIPVIGGAALLNLREIFEQPPEAGALINLSAGTLAAAVTGYFAIILLMDVIRKNRLPWFGYYCLAAAFTGLTYLVIV